MSKEISLEELNNSVKSNASVTKEEPKNTISSTTQKSDLKNAKPISASDIGAHLRKVNNVQEEPIRETPVVENAFNDMYKTLEERKNRIENELMPIVEENAREMAMERELGTDVTKVKLEVRKEEDDNESILTDIREADTSDIDSILNEKDEEVIETAPVIDIEPEKSEPQITEKTVEEPKKASENNDEDDLDSLMKDIEQETKSEDTEEDEESVEELRARFKESLTSVTVSKDPIDLSKFTIERKAVPSAAVLSNINNQVRQFKKADWVLYHTGRSMTFVECRGPELDALRKTISGSNGINGVKESLMFIYNHTLDNNKPPFEAWCKLIRTEDIESLYFGLYRACYSDTNLVARACTGKNGCKKTSLINTNIDDMVKYKDDKTKEKFKNIFNKDSTTESDTFKSELMQISDDIVISFSKPTLYSTFLQYSSLKPEIANKYSDTLNTMAYIDGFFKIDRESNTLIPISIKEYPKNLNKTVLSKLDVYIKILKTLNNDQYNILTAKLGNIINESDITYIYPETTCPECGTTISEEPIDSMLNLLFTRARLIQVKAL